jgi:hypothetical protein
LELAGQPSTPSINEQSIVLHPQRIRGPVEFGIDATALHFVAPVEVDAPTPSIAAAGLSGPIIQIELSITEALQKEVGPSCASNHRMRSADAAAEILDSPSALSHSALETAPSSHSPDWRAP